MEINCKINPNKENLNSYNKLFDWIPNEEQIRPSENIQNMKEIMINKIEKSYNSFRDYILIELFNYYFIKNNNKLKVKQDLHIDLCKFEVSRFRYNLNSKTFHYILWYTLNKEYINEERINRDIKNSIFNIIQNDNFKYIWYENPKMTINDVFHVQVFWIKNT